ncbi:hypothetical protein AMTRI_Chr09g37200 [Amborella trichopoda]
MINFPIIRPMRVFHSHRRWEARRRRGPSSCGLESPCFLTTRIALWHTVRNTRRSVARSSAIPQIALLGMGYGGVRAHCYAARCGQDFELGQSRHCCLLRAPSLSPSKRCLFLSFALPVSL